MDSASEIAHRNANDGNSSLKRVLDNRSKDEPRRFLEEEERIASLRQRERERERCTDSKLCVILTQYARGSPVRFPPPSRGFDGFLVETSLNGPRRFRVLRTDVSPVLVSKSEIRDNGFLRC